VSEIMNALREVNRQYTGMKELYDNTVRELNEARARLASFRDIENKCLVLEATNVELGRLRSDVEKRYEAVQKARDELRRMHADAEKRHTTLQSNVWTLTAQRDALENERDALKTQIASHVKASEYTLRKHVDLTKKYDELSQRYQQLKTMTLADRYGTYSGQFIMPRGRLVYPAFQHGKTAVRNDMADGLAYGMLQYQNAPILRTATEWMRSKNNLATGLPERHGLRWTRSEEEKLVRDYREGKSLDHLVKMHKREWEAIVIRLGRLAGGWGVGSDVDATTRQMKEWYFPPQPKPGFKSNLLCVGFQPRYCK